ncbi:microtubule/TRAF3 and DISC1 binding protein, partial [Streptomyces sp. NPDC093109]
QKQAEAEKRYEEQSRDLGGGNRRFESLNWPSGGVDFPNGSLDNRGGTTTLNPDRSVTMEYPDGSSRNFDPRTGDITTIERDGSTDIDSLPIGQSITNGDGSTTTLNRDGSLTTDFPDGSSSRIDPDAGTITNRQPDGTVTTTEIDSGQTLPSHLGGGSNLPSYGQDGVYSPGGLNSPGGFNGSYGSGNEEALYDDSSSGYGYGSGSGSGSGTPGGMPGPGGMPMLPQGMRMNGSVSGGGNEGERVRNVLDDSSRPITRPGGPQANRFGQSEEEVAAQRGGMNTAGGMPFAPPMGGGMGGGQPQQTQSADRDRAAWLGEDEDVWGTDEGGAPAVIGR